MDIAKRLRSLSKRQQINLVIHAKDNQRILFTGKLKPLNDLWEVENGPNVTRFNTSSVIKTDGDFIFCEW